MLSRSHGHLERCLIVLLAFSSAGNALKCYQKEQDDSVSLNESSKWRMCVFSLPLFGGPDVKPALYGIGYENENLAPYQETFAQNDGDYSVLSTCVVEQYKIVSVERLLRCMCQTDGCNKASTFSDYVVKLRPPHYNNL